MAEEEKKDVQAKAPAEEPATETTEEVKTDEAPKAEKGNIVGAPGLKTSN